MLKFKLGSFSGKALFYGFFSVSQNILSFVFLPILTKYLSMDDFGVYSILLMITSISSAFFYFGASSTLGRFYFEYREKQNLKIFFSTAFFISLIGASLIFTIAFFLSEVISILIFDSLKYSNAILLSLVTSGVSILLNLLTLYIRYNERIRLFSFIMVFGLIVNAFITYILIRYYDLGILSPLFGTLISSFISFLYLFWIHKNLLLFKFDARIWTKFFTFGLPIAFSSVLVYVLDYSDKYIIKEVLDLKSLAVYSLAYKIGSTINVFLIIPFALVWAPFRMRDTDDPNYGKVTGRILYYYLVVGITIIVLSILFGGHILKFFFNKNYDDIDNIFPIIMLAYLVYGLQNIVDIGIHLSKKTYLYFVVFLPAIALNWSLNYFFVPSYGYVAAAYITLVTYTFTTTLIVLFSSFFFKFSIQRARVGFIFIIPVVIFVLTRFECFDDFVTRILLLFFYSVAILLFSLNREEKKMIPKVLFNLKNRFLLWII